LAPSQNNKNTRTKKRERERESEREDASEEGEESEVTNQSLLLFGCFLLLLLGTKGKTNFGHIEKEYIHKEKKCPLNGLVSFGGRRATPLQR